MRIFPVLNLEIGYRALLNDVLYEPDREVAPRGQVTRELDTVVIEHHDPEDALLLGIGRKLSPTLAVVEALQLIGGFSDPKVTVDVAPQYERFRDGDEFHGAYGIRAGQWFEAVVDKLKTDPNTRQSVVTLWDNNLDNVEEGLHDYPCSVYVRFAIRGGKLRTTVHMRSNDAWLGYPYDVYQWTCVHRTVASFLGVTPGVYTHIVDSFHLYDTNFDDAEQLLQGEWHSGIRPKVSGGVLGSGDWASVQRRARAIFNGEVVDNSSVEERWMMNIIRKYREMPTLTEMANG